MTYTGVLRNGESKKRRFKVLEVHQLSKQNHNHDHEHKDPTIETLQTPPPKIIPAKIEKRFAAGVIDSTIVAACWLALIVLAGRGLAVFSLAIEGPIVLITFLYYFIFEWLFAATIGKSVMHLRVVEKNGDQCSLRSSFLRNLLRFIDWLPFLYILGGASIFISKTRCRLGDIVAGTMVTAAPEKDINPPPAPFLFH
ncbi:MAG TPA: RDD family protein [Candidatus Acidoferrales bacterium]|nr:RDD family protein [Candidatus Acidoferrales bacterium]